MAEKLTFEKVKAFIDLEVDEFQLEDIRRKHGIAGDCSVFYTSITRLCQDKIIKRIARGFYKKVKIVKPIKIFGRERRQPIILNAPRDRETGEPMSFFADIVFRQGDLILISGFKNKTKTGLCLNIIGENLDMYPVLMGNEYTIATGVEGELTFEPSPRLLIRLDNMNWVQWVNGRGEERFELLPVYEDYGEQIRAGRLNAIDWINLPPGEYFRISKVTEEIKQGVGTGIAVAIIQKNPDAEHGRGGWMSKDFADVELLLDSYGEDKDAVLLTVETVKESLRPVQGHTFVYKMRKGVEIVDFREVVKCGNCYGKGWRNNRPCDVCNKLGYVDKEKP